MAGKSETAVLGGGCFWCVEAVYKRTEGVVSVTSGYAGGETPNPTYEQVCMGNTGHAEVVKVEFNPQEISFAKILDLFWKAHDPTTLDRQGADVGSQYRSVILYSDDAQKQQAEASREKAQANFSDPIVTEIAPLTTFYPAEQYHQEYFDKHPQAGYCRVVIQPKLQKLGMSAF